MKIKIRNLLLIILILLSVYYCLRYPEDIGQSVLTAVSRCLTVIIPSMYIFMCITSFITRSGLHRLLGRPFRFIAEKIFRIPAEGFAVFILSMIAGYPAGVKLVSDCFRSGGITSAQAKRMNCFCFASGPAFISGTAAGILYPDSNAGLLIFLSVTSGNIAVALISALFSEKVSANSSIKPCLLSSGCLISSVKSASSAIMQMCIMIAAFGGFCCILKLTGILQYLSYITGNAFEVSPEIVYSVLMSLLEISNIVNLPVMNISLMPVAAALLSAGGVCVLIQVIALSDKNFSIKKFVISRIAAACISAVSCRLLMRFLNISTVSEVLSCKIVSDSKYSPLPTILLVVMMIMLLGLFRDTGKTKAD